MITPKHLTFGGKRYNVTMMACGYLWRLNEPGTRKVFTVNRETLIQIERSKENADGRI